MAASVPEGSKFWHDGVVVSSVVNGSNDPGSMKFWFDGQVFGGISPVSPPPGSSIVPIVQHYVRQASS